MGSKQICISKRLVKIALFSLLLFGGYLFLSQRLINSQKILINHASSGEDNLNIIGGEEVKPGEFPSVVYIFADTYDRSSTLNCTGVLIGSRWVMTARHCVINSGTAKIIVGSVNKVDFSEALKINAIMPPFLPEFQSNDMALLLLENEVNISSFPKLPQPSSDERFYSTTNTVTTVGWGCTDIEPSITPASTDIDSEWKVCSPAKTWDECKLISDEYGGRCTFLSPCNICIPFGHKEIDYSVSLNWAWSCMQYNYKISQIQKDNSVSGKLSKRPNPKKIFSGSLRKLNLPIAEAQVSVNKNEFKIGYSDSRSLRQTNCSGDSGGPAFYMNDNGQYILGIHSGGYSGTIEGLSTEARVIESTKWIEEIMNNPLSIPTLTPTPTPRDCREIKDINKCNDECAWYSCAKEEYKCFTKGNDVCTD